MIIPKENDQAIFKEMTEIEVIPVERLDEVFALALTQETDEKSINVPQNADIFNCFQFTYLMISGA